MRRGETAPTVGAMEPTVSSCASEPLPLSPERWLSSSQPCSSPTRGDDAGEAIRIVAESGFWTAGRLLDLIGVLLTVGALTVVGRTFAEGPGGTGPAPASPSSCSWARSAPAPSSRARPWREVADAWVAAAPQAKAVLPRRLRHHDQP